MNSLKGQICDILNKDDIVLVKLACNDEIFSVLMLDLSSLNKLKKNQSIELIFKENELCFGSLTSSLSIGNSFEAKITKIIQGELLTQVFFDFKGSEISSIISKEKALNLKLSEGQIWLCFIAETNIILRTNYA